MNPQAIASMPQVSVSVRPRTALEVQECCSWCRQPVDRCRDASCDESPTYGGILVRGAWQQMEVR
jgi:hypothetical protein